MRLFIKHAPIALGMFDRDMRYILASQRWMTDFHLTETVIGRSHYDVFPDIPARWHDVHKRGLAGETIRGEEDRFDRLDGRTQWLRWEVHPWLLDTGEIGGVLIFTEDITSRNEAESERERLHIEIAKHSERLRAEQRFRALLEAAPDAMVIVNAEGKIVLANSQAEHLYGYSRQELLEQPVEMLLPDRLRAIHCSHRARYFAEPGVRPMGASLELIGRRKDGSTFPAEVSLSPVEIDEERLVSSAIRDISERKKAEDAVLRLAAIVDSAYDAIISNDLNGIIRSWNPAAERMFGYASAEVVGQNICILVPSERDDEERWHLEQARRGERVEPYETVRRRKDGSLIDVWVTTAPLKDSQGIVIGTSKIARDLTERKEMERMLEEEAHTDALTGTATRRYFQEVAHRELARVRRHGGAMSLVTLDVDHFKKINDGYGHAVGDRVLQAVARECREILREEDTVARLGGDEFVLLLTATGSLEANKVAERLRMAFTAVEIPTETNPALHFTASIGVAALTPDDASIDDLLLRADKALYTAKQAGRNTVHVDNGPQ
jgi:diguanylate cyclase (GGDEF)-like protein/PAS domain S-box-containing protein